MYWKPKKDVDKDSSSIKEKPRKIKTASNKLNIKTYRQAKAIKASTTKNPGSSEISSVDHPEVSLESTRSEKSLDDSFPNIEKEIKDVLHKVKISNRAKKVQGSTATCYQTRGEANTHKENQKDLYNLDSDEDFQTNSKKTHKLLHTIRKQDSKIEKTKKQLDQVSIVSSTTEELVRPSSRTTRSSTRRNEVVNETLQSGQDALLNIDQNYSRTRNHQRNTSTRRNEVINETIQSGQDALLNIDQNYSRTRNHQRNTRRLTAISECNQDTDDTLEYEPISLKKSTRKSKKSLDSNESVTYLDNSLTDDVTWKPSEIERLNV